MEDELTLRDLVEILRRKKGWIFGLTLLAIILGGVYAFLLAKPVYQSYAVLGVNPLDIKARLESKIELQPANVLPPETLETLLLSQEVLVKTAESLLKLPELPEEWRNLTREELAATLKDSLELKVASSKSPQQGEIKGTIITAKLQAEASRPELASEIANRWAQFSVYDLNKIPTAQLEANLKAISDQLPEAEEAFRKAQTDWEEFQRRSKLESYKKELAYRIAKGVNITKDLENIEQSLRVNEKRLQAIRDRMALEAGRYPGRPSEADLVFVGKDLPSALQTLSKRLAEARKSYQERRQALDQLKREFPIETWKQELSKYQSRLASIELKLKELRTQKALVETKLASTQGMLSSTPMRLTLKREVTKEPVTLALKQKPSDLAGLILENEALNPLYTSLEKRASDLKTQLASIEAETKALTEERAELQSRERELRGKLTDTLSKMEALQIELGAAKKHYESLNHLYTTYQGLTKKVFIEPDQSRYQSLKSKELGLELEISTLKAQREGLLEWQAQNQKRMEELKRLVAATQLEADRLQENLRLTKETYLALKQKQTDLKIELASVEGSYAQVLAPAYPDPEPVAPKKALILALSGILGLMLGVFAAFVSAALEAPPESPAATQEA